MTGLFGKVGKFLTDSFSVTNPDGFTDQPMTVSSHDFKEGLRRCSTEDERRRYAHGVLSQHKQDFKHPNLSFSSLKAMLRQCIICDSIGIDVTFSSFYSITLVQSATSLSDKRFGYMICQALLTEQSDLTIMLISVLQQDIRSRDPAVICLALECCSSLVSSVNIPSVLELVLDRTKYPHLLVRRNAFCCLSAFIIKSPSRSSELAPYFKMAMTDKHPSVMIQAIHGYINLCKSGHTCDIGLIKPLLFVLQQIIEKKLPAGISRHDVNGFYLSLKIIQTLCLLNKQSSFEKDISISVSFKLVTLLDQLDKNTSLTAFSVKSECCYCLLELSHHTAYDSINSHITQMLSSKQNLLCLVGAKLLHTLSNIDKKYLTPNSKLIVQHLTSKNKELSDYSFKLILLHTNQRNIETVFRMITQQLNDTSVNPNHVDNYLKLISLHNQPAHWILTKLNQLYSKVQITPEIMDKTYFALEKFETKVVVEFWQHISKNVLKLQLDLMIVCLAVRPLELTENLSDIYCQVGTSITSEKSNNELYEIRVSWYLTSLRPLGIYSQVNVLFNDSEMPLANQILLKDTKNNTVNTTPAQFEQHSQIINKYLQKSDSFDKIRKPASKQLTTGSLPSSEVKQSVSQTKHQSINEILNKPAKRVWSKQGRDKSANSGLSKPAATAQHGKLSSTLTIQPEDSPAPTFNTLDAEPSAPSSELSQLGEELLKS